MRNFYKNLKNIFTLLTILLLGSINAWGNSINISGSGFNGKVGNNVANLGGNHASFQMSGSTVEYSSTLKNVYLGSVNNNSSASFTISWTKNSGCTLNVTKIQVKGSASANGTMQLSGGSESSKGKSFDVSTTSISGTSATLTCRGKAGKAFGIGIPSLFYMTDIIITYTITPDKPTIKATTATVNVSLNSENQLDMTNVVTVADVNDFMPVAWTSNSFNDPQGVSTSGAYTFTGKYFYATKAGVYTFTNPYISAKSNCHEESATTTGTVTITVNRLNQNLTMANGSVDVTTDKSNPITLDLSTLKTQTGNGAVTYSLVGGPTSVDGKSAANNCSISGNNFYAWVGGTYTLKSTAAKTAQYNAKESSNFTVTVNKKTQTISWSTNETTFVEEDVISANSIGDVTLEKSGAGADYITLNGNTATVGEVTSNTTVTLTATAAPTDVYAQATDSKTITLTSLAKQHITFDQNLTKLKTTDSPRKVELVATSDSNRDSYIYFTISANSDGVTVTQENGKWYLNYPATACKNIMVTAHLDGVAGTYVPASDVSQMVKVTDPTAKCDNTESLATASSLCNTSKTYNLTVPKKVVLKVRCSKSKIYANGYNVKFYNAQNQQVGSTQSFDGHTWDQSVYTHTFDNLDKSITKMVFTSNASNGFDITEASYERWYYANPSVNALNYEAYALSTVADQSLTISYANYQVELSIEGSSNFVLKSDDSFGDCETYGTQTVTVGYNVPATAQEETAYLRIKDNTGALLNSVTLHANVLGGLTQNITSHNIATSYKTTDKITLTAETDRGLTNFSYSASPVGVASFAGNVMTFNQSGTIAITVTEAGNATFDEATETVNNVVVSKVTPAIATNPTGASIKYLQTLNASTLSDGRASVTLRGVENTTVAGSFAWKTPTHQVTDNAGSHSYKVVFTPTDGGMYTTKEFDLPITILRADASITMNNGSVKVAVVDGIDAGKADSYLDLDGLIASQTNDAIDASRAGAVTYKVISANKDNATISGSIFSATVVDTYTIRATKAATDYYNEATADFTVTVGKRANTMVISGTAYAQYVDSVVENIRSVQNSDATVQTSSNFPTIAYYDVDSNMIRIPNSESNYQMFGAQKEVTIKIWQEATDRFEASGEKTITLTVHKYVTTSNGNDIILEVNETKDADYGFTNTSAAYPSSNLNDDFYYTIDEPSFENAALNNGDKLITYNPATNQITGHNAGTTKITFYQNETYKHTGVTLMCNVAVEKKNNTIKNSWENSPWQVAMNENENLAVSFTSDRGDYTNSPIVIEQIYGEDVAAMSGSASGATITTDTTKGYAIWHLTQAENYEYYAAQTDLMVTVGVPAPPTCYVYQDMNEHSFKTAITDAEGHFENPIVINSPIDKIWYSAKRQWAGVNFFVVQYSTDNGTTWNNLSEPDLETDYSNYSASFPNLGDNKKITHVRFGAKTGATLSKWYKDVQISRRSYLTIQDAEHNKISQLPTMECTIDETSTAEAKFYIDYSTCDDKIIIESSDPTHFTVNRSQITANGDNLNSAKEEITVTYHSEELGTHSAMITVRTSYQTSALSVSGETTKRVPELIWQEGYTNNPLTLPVGLVVNALKPAAKSTSSASVIYSSDNENVVQILEDGYAFKVVGVGSATLTATAPENDKWKSVSGTRVIQATEKIVQEIVWDQNFPRFMTPGDVIDLDAKVYLRNLSTGTLTYSAERSQYISYSCPLNNGIATVSNNKLTILDYGEVKVTAAVGGNADYAAAASVIMLVHVRQPSVGCPTPLVLDKQDAIDMFDNSVSSIDASNYFNLTTEEMISSEIELNSAQGKPDKLSFQYRGEVYKVPVIGAELFGGFIKFEQRVNQQWIAVDGSRVETAKNEWNSVSNLQLDENADALRIIREAGATGHHYIKDIQVTRKQYLRATQTALDLGEIKLGQSTTVNIGFDYSDVKGDLTARTINNTTDVTIKDNGVIDVECGSFGHYNLPITFTPTKVDSTWEGAIEVFDDLTSLNFTVALTAKVTANEQYIFNEAGNWNDSTNWTTRLVPDENADVIIAKDLVINATASVNSITINEGVTVTVAKGITLAINDTIATSSTGSLYIEDSAKVIVPDGTTLNLKNFSLAATLSGGDKQATSGQVSGDATLNITGDAYFQITFDPSGAISYGWYDFVLPFDVDARDGVFDTDSNKLTYNVDYAIMEFSEEKRAANEKAWYWYSGTLEAGRLYTITLDETNPGRTTFLFKRKAGASMGCSTTFNTVCTDAGDATAKGWNGLGNGMLRHGRIADGTKVQAYNHEEKRYELVEGDKTFAVGTAFFVQAETGTIDWTAASEDESHPLFAPARSSRATEEFMLTLRTEGRRKAADVLYFSASENATEAYMIGHDLAKMGTPTEAKVAQMWTTKGGKILCDIETSLVNNKANTSLLFYAPQDGSYTLSMEQAPADATLYLTYNNRVIWNLSMSPYEIELNQGTTEGYGLRIVADAKTTTDLENDGLMNEANGVRKVIIDDKIYMITPEGAVYDVLGKGVKY